jgi:hypothetical protein
MDNQELRRIASRITEARQSGQVSKYANALKGIAVSARADSGDPQSCISAQEEFAKAEFGHALSDEIRRMTEGLAKLALGLQRQP